MINGLGGTMYIHERRRLHRVSDTEILHWFDISWGRFVSPHDLDRRVVMTRRAGSTTKSRAIAAFALLALLQVAKNEKKVRAAGAESIVPSCLGLRTNASTRVQCTDEERQQDEAADVRCERMCSLRRRQDDETRRLFVTEHFASPRTEGGREGGKAGREL
ncbi:hypothetical protein AXG93_1913s1780 [Marchantia polymorpha subsp. ruderalis]|uniref:Uncharacterized protein n=1 Tax=Marchantia polymorpha subsp. ruderalis TaxID=1480154 RepID=A0A176WLG2_MARPO|nr:hypothetical protein AXG93_1913s1780 [Marchantia polymorpha subsp. ruderalis]